VDFDPVTGGPQAVWPVAPRQFCDKITGAYRQPALFVLSYCLTQRGVNFIFLWLLLLLTSAV